MNVSLDQGLGALDTRLRIVVVSLKRHDLQQDAQGPQDSQG